MELKGWVQNGVIVTQGPIPLPEGTKVTILAAHSAQENLNSLQKLLLGNAGMVDDLPEDMARNHDQYLYGTPKK